MRQDNADIPLEVEIEDRCLVIRIGINTLAMALRHCPFVDELNGERDYEGERVVVINAEEFAKAVATELRGEEENGTTLVHRMFDKAFEQALESGCDGVTIDGQ